MRMLRVLLLAGTAGVSWNPALAADTVKPGPAPAWVHPHELPTIKSTDAPVLLLLHDEQIAFDHGKVTTYREAAVKLQTAQGLAAGNISIVWQPEADTVTVNRLRIIRDGKIIDVLAGGQTFTVLRRETNLDAATLDGTLTATLQPEGLQVGDILDLATTTEHSDPVMKGHVEAMFAEWGGLPTSVTHSSLEWPAAMRVDVRQTPNLPRSQKTSANGITTIDLSGRDVDPLVPPKAAPDRYRIGRLAEASDYASWSDVADLMMPLFKTASAIPASGPLHDEVEKIRSASSDPLARATLALALVQDRVRYVALLMGQGGYVPASAEQTWSRRFGDCKAKTALLIGVLRSLGVQAEPVLAQTQLGDMIADRLPMVALFNHVLVRAHIAGKDYWLDGTRTGDTGLNAIEIPDFGWGLPLVEHAALVHMVPRPLDRPSVERHLTIDASAGVYAEAPITIEEIYRGDTAVELNTLFSSATADQRDEAMHDKAKGYFDGFTVSSSNQQFDKAKREFDLTIKGSSKLSWKDGWFSVPTSSIGFDPDFDRPVGPLHDAPVAVRYPRFVKDEAVFRLPTGFAAAQKLSVPVHETLAGVEFARSEVVTSTGLTVTSSERSIVPEVTYKDALAAEPRLRTLSKDEVYIRSSVAYQPTTKDLSAAASGVPTSADEYVNRGNLYLNGRKYDQAIADFTAALKLDPGNEWALADRAITYVWKHEMDRAKSDLVAAAAKNPDNSVVLRARGLMAELKGDYAQAITSYTQSLAQEPGNVFTLGHRAVCEFATSKNDEGLADSAEAVKQDPSLMDLRLMRANALLRQGKRDLVAGEADALVRDNPNADFAFVAAAKIYAKLGQQPKAMQALDRALAIKPAAYIYMNRADVRPKSDVGARMTDLDLALKLEPNNVEALVAKSDLLQAKGDNSSALALLQNVTIKTPDDRIEIERFTLLHKLGRTEDERKYLAALRASAKTDIQLNNICWAKATHGIMLESALQDCRDAIKLNPENGAVYDSLGMVLLKLGKLDEALEAYNQAIAKRTGAASLMGRAFVYLGKGDTAHALLDAAAARTAFPGIDKTFADYGLKFTPPRRPLTPVTAAR
jgi:tetratricopeptide (TPR) repeat protein